MSARHAVTSEPPRPRGEGAGVSGVPVPDFETLYAQCFDFVWRTAARLGVPSEALDDVVQEVFLVVHRRLGDFEGRSSVRTWVYGITRRVAGGHRRRNRRARPSDADVEELWSEETGPQGRAEKAQAARLLHELLDTLDDTRREVFVLSELEQMTAPEIAEATGANVNTVYSRLREARALFEQALARHRARERWRLR